MSARGSGRLPDHTERRSGWRLVRPGISETSARNVGEVRALDAGQLQAIRQHLDRIAAWAADRPAFEVAHQTRTDTSPLGQFLLREVG